MREEMDMNDNRVLLFGALIGAVTGLAAAMMLQRRAQKTGREISLSAGEGIQLGVMVLGLLRAVAGLADRDDQR
jgi:phage protein U